jgi:hypothetical protein
VEETEDGEKYVRMHFVGGETCNDNGDTYKMTVNLFCNPSGEREEQPVLTTNVDHKCNPVFDLRHRYACPVFSATTFSRFFIDRPYILGPIAIVFGLVVALAGRKFFPWTITIIGCAIGATTAFLLFSMFDILDSIKGAPMQDSTYFLIFQYFVACTTGLFVGFIL